MNYLRGALTLKCGTVCPAIKTLFSRLSHRSSDPQLRYD